MKLLVIDDHPLSRDGLRLALRDVDERIDVLEAAELADAFEVLAQHGDVRLIILDPDLTYSRGIETMRLMKTWLDAQSLDIRIVVFSGTTDAALVTDVLDQHGTGVILKGASRQSLREAFQLTLAGGVYTPDTLPQQTIPVPGSAYAAYTAAGAAMIARLTAREVEVLRLLSAGHTYRRIAEKLDKDDGTPVSPRTVHKHVTNIARKFDVTASAKSGVLSVVARHGMLLGSDPLLPRMPTPSPRPRKPRRGDDVA